MNQTLKLLFSLLLFIGLSPIAHADDVDDIAAIIKSDKAPEGVVFEILASHNGLQWAIPRIKKFSTQLRGRFPNIAIAVVSHGNEQFALQSKHNKKYSNVHQQVKSLVNNDDIKIHVCGTFAEWKGVTPEEFPDYIDVSAEGPAQIHDYEALGYITVVLSKPGL